MPQHGAQALGMRCPPLGCHGWDNHASCGDFARESSVAAYDSENLRARLDSRLECADDVDGDVLLPVPAANRKHQHAVARIDPRSFQPCREAGLPAFVISARREFRYVVSGSVCFKTADLAEVVYGVSGVSGRSADAQDEKPAAVFPDAGQGCGHALDFGDVKLLQDGDWIGNKHRRETAAYCSR